MDFWKTIVIRFVQAIQSFASKPETGVVILNKSKLFFTANTM
jgi:hypothetical protein